MPDAAARIRNANPDPVFASYSHLSRLFTSESVTEGHPDKIADQISDAVVDAVLKDDPQSRVACETLVTTGFALVAGEITTESRLHIPELVRRTIRAAGYTRGEYGIDADSCEVLVKLDEQSPEIGAAVDEAREKGKPLGAGDQGMMFGFACDDTPELMPAPISAAHALVRRLSAARRSGEIPWLRPDGKSQVTFEYGDNWRPRRIGTVVLSAQHEEGLTHARIRDELVEKVVRPALAGFAAGEDAETVYHINPSGSFVRGGPHGDAGLTGRKIIVDTYGGFGRHGGGAFSGKDATKVDRSGAYAARWAAKNLVASGGRLPVRGAARLRDRGCRAGAGLGGQLRDRSLRARRRGAVARGAGGVRLPSPIDHPRPGAGGTGLWSNSGVRALRPGARDGGGRGARDSPLRLGTHRPGE